MFALVIKRQVKHAKILTPTFFSHNDRKKSTALPIPDSVQIIKPVQKSSSSAALRIKTINKAMKAYLERSRQYDDFLKIKMDEFEIGKQHLANMMGLEASSLTQDDIDKAITYLLPSGLYEKKARPLMKPPHVLFPKEKAAQFDSSGRPFSPFFYTRKGNFYTALHSIVEKFHELDAFEDKMISKGILEPPHDARLNMVGWQWLSLDELKVMFLERLGELDYDIFIKTLNRLGDHPYSFRVKDELMKYRKEIPDFGALDEIPELMKDADGRPFMEALGHRKHCDAKVVVRGNGTGKIIINGADVFYFWRLHDREQIMYPLEFTGLLGKVDVEVDVSGPGETAQAGAIRLGISLCLRSFVEPNDVEKMRLGGLLAVDRRRRRRKLPGQKGNRAKFTWKKR